LVRPSRSAARQYREPCADGYAEGRRFEASHGPGNPGARSERDIGIALDLRGGHMYYTDLGGHVYSANLDGSNNKTILTGQGELTGITWVDSAYVK
jgi:hypothetical protein